MLKIRPSLVIALSFLVIINLGALLLSLPISSSQAVSTNYLDAYFTANSATCVTGLVTLDTGTHFSLFGLIIIMLLMQVGGLGYMTFSTLFILVFRKKMFISEKLMLVEALNIYSMKDTVLIIKKIAAIVFLVEGMGALILFLRFLPEMGFKSALLYGIFHAISAFNNAGFALPANFANLCPYVTDWVINLTITTLIIIGGIGFIVIADVMQFKRWSLHTKITIMTTLVLIIVGSLAYFGLEYHNTLSGLSLPHKGLASYFQAVTPRTAGFNTLDMAKLLPSAALFIMFLMFVGASPGSTGGGIKTTTFAVAFFTLIATLKNSRDTVLFNRRIPVETVRRAFTIIMLSLAVIAMAVFILSNTEKASLLQIGFEVFSAFGTVGLSMNLTPYLTSVGKIVIIIVMFIGRVGPLTLLLALMMNQKEPKTLNPKEGISIG